MNAKVQKTINDAKTKANQLWNYNPAIAVGLAIASANAAAQLIKANTERKNAKTWRREVNRREKKTLK